MSDTSTKYEVVNTETGETLAGPYSTVAKAEGVMNDLGASVRDAGGNVPLAVSVVYEGAAR